MSYCGLTWSSHRQGGSAPPSDISIIPKHTDPPPLGPSVLLQADTSNPKYDQADRSFGSYLRPDEALALRPQVHTAVRE